MKGKQGPVQPAVSTRAAASWQVANPARWLVGLCAGSCVAVALLFCASAWGVEIQTFGDSPGARVFYGSWLLCTLVALYGRPRVVLAALSALAGLGFLGASAGGHLRASAAMRLHPVVLGVNLSFLGIGIFGLVLGLRTLRNRNKGRVSS